MEQLSLDLGWPPRYGEDDFLPAAANGEALGWIERWPNWPHNTLMLIGPVGAGKTHLATIWARRAGGVVVPADHLLLGDLPAMTRTAAVALDQADRVAGIREAELFHLMNMLGETGGALLLTSDRPPDQWGLRTPDLLSRLRRALTVFIDSPDEALMRAMLVKLFHDKQLLVEENIIDYLIRRIDRSFAAAAGVVAMMDREALSQGRALTRAVARDALRKLYPQSEDEDGGDFE